MRSRPSFLLRSDWRDGEPVTLLNLTATSRFKDMVQASAAVAATEFGRNSKEHKAVKAAWKEVGF